MAKTQPGLTGHFDDRYPKISPGAKAMASEIGQLARSVGYITAVVVTRNTLAQSVIDLDKLLQAGAELRAQLEREGHIA